MLSQKDYLLDLSKEKALNGFPQKQRIHHGPRVVCGAKQMGTTPEGSDPWVKIWFPRKQALPWSFSATSNEMRMLGCWIT